MTSALRWSPTCSNRTAQVLLEAPLLGDPRRRNCEAPALRFRAPEGAIRSALRSAAAVHTVSLGAAPAAAATAEPEIANNFAAAAGGAVAVDEAEEFAVRSGYLEHMEDEFFGVDGEEDEDDGEDDDKDDDGEMTEDFWAQFAQMPGAE